MYQLGLEMHAQTQKTHTWIIYIFEKDEVINLKETDSDTEEGRVGTRKWCKQSTHVQKF